MSIEQTATLLYLPLNNTPNAKGILTGKFFEYLASKRPILAIGPTDGDLAQILAETNAGCVCDFEDTSTLIKIIQDHYKNFLSGNLSLNSYGIEKFSRKNLTLKLVDVFNSLVDE